MPPDGPRKAYMEYIEVRSEKSLPQARKRISCLEVFSINQSRKESVSASFSPFENVGKLRLAYSSHS